jgi:predicted lipoprotein with Yx(FWY)xxD motif
MRAGILAFVSTLAISTTAWAQPGNDTDADEAARTGEEGGVTVYDFDDDNVDGEILSPDGANVNARGRG